MSSGRVVLHVGLAKTGTTYLQSILAEHRDVLRAQGVLYPFLGHGTMFRGAVDVRGSAARFGLVPDDVTGTWAALCARAREHDGTTVISHEVLAGASPAQVEEALALLPTQSVRILVTARDLGRQATAHWQEEVKLGGTASFADFERDQLRVDTGPDDGPDAGGRRPHFWHAQDFADTLHRWGACLPAGRVELVVAPAPGAHPDELWRRYAGAIGVDPASVVTPTTRANASLSAESTALLRAVNARLEGRLPTAQRHRLVKREWAETVLAGRPGTPLQTPAGLAELLGHATDDWVDRLHAAGHPVHGDVADLRPRTGAPGDPHPDVLLDQGGSGAGRDELEALVAGFLAAPRDAASDAPVSPPRWRDRLRGRGRGPTIGA